MSDSRRILDESLYVHFITFSVDRGRRLLELDHPKRIVLNVLNEVRTRFSAKCVGYVLMPDHVHALVWFPVPNQISRFMQEWKRRSSLELRAWYRSESSHYFQSIAELSRFWQPKYYAFQIENREKLEEKLNYMHANPVRARLVKRATDWKWSSARWYENRQCVGVPIEWGE